MKVDIMEYEKCYSFNLEPITQLCGQNIIKKTYIFESIRRYFSTYKYREEQNKWRDNLRLDGVIVGRRTFEVISISNVNDILTLIKWSKQSLIADYVKQLTQSFEWQTHLQIINEELERMFQLMNMEVRQLGHVELVYEMSKVWDMVQKSEVLGSDHDVLDDKSSYELLMIFINLIEAVQKSNPRKMLVLMENLDHLLICEEYMSVIEVLCGITKKYNIYFVLSTSIDGYVKYDKELCTGINIFGDVDFQMPKFDKIVEFIHEGYPCNKMLTDEQICNDIRSITQRIGQKEFLYSIEESVICKMFNKSLLLNDKWEEGKMPEISFLKS